MKVIAYTADQARDLANGALLRKLNLTKQKIMDAIYQAAYIGDTHFLIYIEDYDVSCPEDWSNIYNWLLELGYDVEDNSNHKIHPNFFLEW